MFSLLTPEIKSSLQDLLKSLVVQANATKARPLWLEFEREYPTAAYIVKSYIQRNNAGVIRGFLLSLPLSDEVKGALQDEKSALKFIEKLKEEIK